MDAQNLSDKQKQELLEKAYRLGYAYEGQYENCAQSVIAALQDTFEIKDDSVFKAGFCLAGGGGLKTLGNCGALSGSLMMIGAICGRNRENLTTGRKYRMPYKQSQLFIEKFTEKYGGLSCCEVQHWLFGRSYDLTNREQYKAFEEAGGHRDKCTDVVGTAARWLAEMIVNGEVYEG